MAKRRFAPGWVVATPGAAEAFSRTGDNPYSFVRRHESGDWGDLDQEDRMENERSVSQGFRIFSSYRLSRWWADRVREWQGMGRDVFVYFNNDSGGNAVRNALTLKGMVGA